jgi:hypothetical protein
LQFIVYFSILNVIVVTILITTRFVLVPYLRDDDKRATAAFGIAGMKKRKLRKLIGLMFAISGGIIASETVILLESSVQLMKTTFSGQNQFTSFQPFLIIIILLITAFTQVYCMNSALKVADATIVVPVFFAFYSVLALLNACVYYNQWSKFDVKDYVLILFGIVVLVIGVYFISASQATSQRQQQQQQPAAATASSSDPTTAIPLSPTKAEGSATTAEEATRTSPVLVKSDSEEYEADALKQEEEIELKPMMPPASASSPQLSNTAATHPSSSVVPETFVSDTPLTNAAAPTAVTDAVNSI